MAFEDVLGVVSRWLVATEALAALGAEMSLAGSPGSAHPEMTAALRDVSAAAGLTGLDELAPPQRGILTALARLALHQALDLLEDPARPPGWAFTDPAILEGWGRGSAMVPASIAAGLGLSPGSVRSFLDVGTGVGLFAVAAAAVWPAATIVGIDVWGPSLDVAEANVRAAGLRDRITLREQDVASIDDVDAYDGVWFPTFFVTEDVLDAAMPRLARATRSGGWLVLGRMAPPPDPLALATARLRTIRSGGADFDTDRLVAALEAVGCVDAHALPHQPGVPLEYVVGRRPA